jgi:hypothetical protein
MWKDENMAKYLDKDKQKWTAVKQGMAGSD